MNNFAAARMELRLRLMQDVDNMPAREIEQLAFELEHLNTQVVTELLRLAETK